MVEVALRLLDEGVDLFESFKIPNGRRQEEAENHIDIVGESFATLLLETHEVDHHVGLIIANRDGDVTLVDDTKRYGGIWRAASDLLDVRDTENDEHPSVVVFITGTLIGIADIRKEIVGNLKFIFQQALVFIGWPA